jgi:hypothetical protein
MDETVIIETPDDGDGASTDAVDASRAEASAEAAAESAIVAATVAAGTAAVAEQEAASTIASYEERLGVCQAELTSVTQSQAALSGEVASLRTEMAAMAESQSLILSKLAPEPEPNPENPPEPEPVAEPPAAEEPAPEPEPVKERRRAHRWI